MDNCNKYEWIVMPYKEAIYKISTNNKKVKQKEYVPDGKYPVIDQGRDFIGGFTNDESKLLNCVLPALVFGDHTKIVKLVNYNFVPGADGVKIIVPRLFFNAKLFEIFTKIIALKIPDKGYTRHFQYIEKSEIPLPPLPEQRAIVSKIEQLFSDLDNGIENFKKAQEQLKIYRQAVLKNACEGKLVSTEAELGRTEGREYEPADVLLARILEERREKWNGKGKYKEPAAPDTSGLSELPAGWCYTHIEMLLSTERTGIKTGPFGSLLKKHEHIIEGIPVLGIENIKAMKFIAGSKIHITKEKSTQLSSYDALPDDVLISRSGTVGEVCIVPEGLGESRISTNLMRVSLTPNGMLPIFFTFLFNGAPYILDQITDLCKGSTRNFLNRGILFSLIFTLPPLAEQRRIVIEVERRLSICDKMEETITESLQKAESLRQSILKKAFEGKLLNEKELEEVRNAPDWEPAEKLLERIKAEKTNTKAKKKGRK